MQENMDEIDLFDLVDDIKEQWLWLVGTGTVCVMAALLTAHLGDAHLQTEVVFKPVREADLLPLNQPRLKDVLGVAEKSTTSKQAFAPIFAIGAVKQQRASFYQELLKGDNTALKATDQNLSYA